MFKKLLLLKLILLFFIPGLNATRFTGRNKKIFTAHNRSVTCVAFSPDSKYLTSVSLDRRTKVWRTATKNLVNSLYGHKNWVLKAAYSPYGKYFATTGKDKRVIIRHASTGNLKKIIYAHDYGIDKVFFSNDSKKIYSFCFRSKTLLIHKVKNASLLRRVDFKTKHRLTRAGVSPDLKTVALDEGTSISLWNAETGKKIKDFKGGFHSAGVFSIVFSPDGKTLASGGGSSFSGKDGTIKIWDVKTAELIKTIKAHYSDLILAFTPDGKYLISASKDRKVKIWKTKDFSLIKKLSAKYESFWSIAVSKNAKYIAAGTESGYIVIWRTKRLGIY